MGTFRRVLLVFCMPSNITHILPNVKMASFGLRRTGWPQIDGLGKDCPPELEGHCKTEDREE